MNIFKDSMEFILALPNKGKSKQKDNNKEILVGDKLYMYMPYCTIHLTDS